MIASTSDRCGFSKENSDKLLETILEMMKGTHASEEDVITSGFGKFSVRLWGGLEGENCSP
jgi:nucleoid DNA-binding protein